MPSHFLSKKKRECKGAIFNKLYKQQTLPSKRENQSGGSQSSLIGGHLASSDAHLACKTFVKLLEGGDSILCASNLLGICEFPVNMETNNVSP